MGEGVERSMVLLERYLARSSSAVKEALEGAIRGERLTFGQGLALYREAELPSLSLASSIVRWQKHKSYAYYNRNGHIEPTNICYFNCSFCSFRKESESKESWLLTLSEIVRQAKEQAELGNSEVHITGGVYPSWRLEDLEEMVQAIHTVLPQVHIKAFSAIELLAIFKWSNVSLHDGIRRLKDAGLGSIPGGGAEIFNEAIRSRICPEKGSSEDWLALHEEAHRQELSSNATMLFGHIERYEDRIDHMERLRILQDKTGGFNCFIPLKYRSTGNSLGSIGEVSLHEVLRNFAVSRLYLDNISHLKAYWPMLGKENIPIALSYGVDDLDGTIGNTTKIYSMAGAEDRRPEATVEELRRIIIKAGYQPVERNSLYEVIEKTQLR